MGKNFRETLHKRLEDPAFRAEWGALEPERQALEEELLTASRRLLCQNRPSCEEPARSLES